MIPSGTIVKQKEAIGASLWASFILCFLCNVSAGLISTLMSAYLPKVVQEFRPTSSTQELGDISGYIQALYIAGWAVGGFFWGFISDKVGRVKALGLSTALFGMFSAVVAIAISWEYVVFLRFLSGVAVGGILVITPTLLFEIWPAESRAVIIGIDSIGFPVGIFSSGVVTVLIADWRNAFVIGIIPFLLAMIVLLIIRESVHWKRSTTSAERSKPTPQDKRKLLQGSIIFGSMLIGLWGMFSWIPTWVQSLLSGSDGQAERGAAMMLLGIGGLGGGFASGWIANAIGVRRAMMACFGGCVVASVALFALNKSFSGIIYAELAILSCFFGISQGLLSIYIPQLFPVSIRGTFTGICFNIGRILTAVAILFVGMFVTFFNGYGNTLLAFAGIFVIGFIAILFLRNQS